MPPGLNPIHVFVVLVVALIVLGPEKLPDAARTLGRFINDFRAWSAAMQAEARDMLDVGTRTHEVEPQAIDVNGSNGAEGALPGAGDTAPNQ